jgi:hypothetical protein
MKNITSADATKLHSNTSRTCLRCIQVQIPDNFGIWTRTYNANTCKRGPYYALKKLPAKERTMMLVSHQNQAVLVLDTAHSLDKHPPCDEHELSMGEHAVAVSPI